MWLRLSRVWGGLGTVSGILVMAPYPDTRSTMRTMAFATSVRVSENAQKNLDESTLPIGRTRLMKTRIK